MFNFTLMGVGEAGGCLDECLPPSPTCNPDTSYVLKTENSIVTSAMELLKYKGSHLHPVHVNDVIESAFRR